MNRASSGEAAGYLVLTSRPLLLVVVERGHRIYAHGTASRGFLRWLNWYDINNARRKTELVSSRVNEL